jgi:hypothetical protein
MLCPFELRALNNLQGTGDFRSDISPIEFPGEIIIPIQLFDSHIGGNSGRDTHNAL